MIIYHLQRQPDFLQKIPQQKHSIPSLDETVSQLHHPALKLGLMIILCRSAWILCQTCPQGLWIMWWEGTVVRDDCEGWLSGWKIQLKAKNIQNSNNYRFFWCTEKWSYHTSSLVQRILLCRVDWSNEGTAPLSLHSPVWPDHCSVSHHQQNAPYSVAKS